MSRPFSQSRSTPAGVFRLIQTCRLSKFRWAYIVFPQPASLFFQNSLSRFEVQFGDRNQSSSHAFSTDHAPASSTAGGAPFGNARRSHPRDVSSEEEFCTGQDRGSGHGRSDCLCRCSKIVRPFSFKGIQNQPLIAKLTAIARPQKPFPAKSPGPGIPMPADDSSSDLCRVRCIVPDR